MDGSPLELLGAPARIAIIGAGISGLSAAWLLDKTHEVTLFEKEGRIGGHSNTIDVESGAGPVPVDTGFIVYNEPNYPNLVALFDHLGVQTKTSDMSFSVSTDGGRFEYAGSLAGLFARRRNVASLRFWTMLRDIRRFYRDAPRELGNSGCDELTLGEYLEAQGYSEAFVNDHILPMGAAIWSSPIDKIRGYPLGAFLRFFDNHRLFNFRDRPSWRTVKNGSRSYVRRLVASLRETVKVGCGVAAVRRSPGGVTVLDQGGRSHGFDHVVIAAHADQALSMLANPDQHERRILGAFKYSTNRLMVHGDTALMPCRRRAWASWNYLREDTTSHGPVSVTYWMNRLQGIPTQSPLFVSLNPWCEPDAKSVFASFTYEHPIFDHAALAAQKAIGEIQGVRNTWFCGSYLGSGFHEDALQSGLAVAEALGGVMRPWHVAGKSAPLGIADHCGRSTASMRFAT